MENIGFLLVFLLANAGKTCILYRLFHCSHKERQDQNKGAEIFLYVGYFILITVSSFINNPSPLLSEVSFRGYTSNVRWAETTTPLLCAVELLCLIIISLYYEKKILKNGILVFLFFMLIRCSELIPFLFLDKTGGMSRMSLSAAGMFLKIISLILLWWVGVLGYGIKNRSSLLYGLLMSTVLAMVWIRFFINLFYQNLYFIKKESYLWLIISLMSFLICEYLIKVREKHIQRTILRQENRYYKSQLETMEQSITAWKKLKHDSKNHMIVLRGMLNMGEIAEAQSYLNRLLDEERAQKEVNTGNTAIDSMINYKMQTAEQRDVTFDLDLRIPEQLPISSYLLSVVLGNAIDNAIEAAEKTAEKNVSLKLQYTKGRLLFQIENPYSGDLQSTDTYEFETMKKEKSEHGFGLKNMREAVEKAGGVMKIETKEQWFVLTILLYVEKQSSDSI